MGDTIYFIGEYVLRKNTLHNRAHELGHIVLGHLEQAEYTTRNREPGQDDAPIEAMANVFASRLPAPARVLHDRKALTPEVIPELCDISLISAAFRAGRMEILEARGRYGTTPLEREVSNLSNLDFHIGIRRNVRAGGFSGRHPHGWLLDVQ